MAMAQDHSLDPPLKPTLLEFGNVGATDVCERSYPTHQFPAE